MYTPDVNRSRLIARVSNLRSRLSYVRGGLPHGCHQLVDIARSLPLTSLQTIVDVGAHHGGTARAFRRRYPGARIVCVEPVPSSLTRLRAIEMSHRLEILPFAAGDRDEEARLLVNATAANMSTLRYDGSEGLAVRVRTLASICTDHTIDRIDYLKIDTEGSDLAVLRGAEPLLAQDRVALVEAEVGMSPDNKYHVPIAEVVGFLEPLGYRLFGIYQQRLEWPTQQPYLRRTNIVLVSPSTVLRNEGRF